MAWNNLSNNQMVSYTDAQGGGFTLKAGQSSQTSDQCMTKAQALAKYNLNPTNMSAYAETQLVPKITWVPANCVRPAGLTQYTLIANYVRSGPNPIPVNNFGIGGTYTDACSAWKQFNQQYDGDFSGVQYGSFFAESTSISVNSISFLGLNAVNCDKILAGSYWLLRSTNTGDLVLFLGGPIDIVTINSSGVITAITPCTPPGLLIVYINSFAARTWSNITNAALIYNPPLPTTGPESPNFNGRANTRAIIAQSGHISSAASVCNSLLTGGFPDWYLGAVGETVGLFVNKTVVNSAITSAGGNILSGFIWSSSEIGSNVAIARSLDGGSSTGFGKDQIFSFRAIRRQIVADTNAYSIGQFAFGGVIFDKF